MAVIDQLVEDINTRQLNFIMSLNPQLNQVHSVHISPGYSLISLGGEFLLRDRLVFTSCHSPVTALVDAAVAEDQDKSRNDSPANETQFQGMT